jgi:formamidopyrimidine-DNA glycosylase
MPELPEVETICRGLRARVVGRRIGAVEVVEPRLRTRVAAAFGKALAVQTITEVGRRAKYILIFLDDDAVWLTHLGMSGSSSGSKPQAAQKHDHIVVRLDGGNELRYHDPRRFGLSLVTTRSGSIRCRRSRRSDPSRSTAASMRLTFMRRRAGSRAGSAIS